MTCKRCGSSSDATDASTATENCAITKIDSKTLDVSGGCPDSGTVWVELREDEESTEEEATCSEVSSLFPTDTIQVMRNGECYTITIDNLLKALDCKKECL